MIHDLKCFCGLIPTVGVALAMTIAGLAHAEEGSASDDSGGVIEEIIVTATKREENIYDTALSISTVTEEKLEHQGITDFSSLAYSVPGVSVTQPFVPLLSVVATRGLSSTIGADATTGFYLDDTSVSIPGNAFGPGADLFDIQRVEVLKGPQGTLYGQGAMGGAIRVITNQPDPTEFGVRAQATYFGTKNGEASSGFNAAVNIPIVQDKLAARVVYGTRDEGGFLDDVTGNLGNNVNDNEFENVRARIAFTPNDKLTISGLYWKYEAEDIFGNNPNSAEPKDMERILDGDVETTYGYEFDLFSGSFSYDLGFATVENTFSVYEPFIPQFFFNGTTTIEADVAIAGEEITSNELRLVSNDDGPFKWMLGGYYREGEAPFYLAVGAGGFIFFAQTQTLDSESYSIFGEASYRFGDWEFLVGGRYFKDDRVFMDDVFTELAFLEDSFDSFNPRFNLKYDLNDDLMIYGNIAKGYRSGLLNQFSVRNNAIALGLADPAVVDPDSLWSYEVGAKGFLNDGQIAFDAAVFYTDWQDTIQQVIVDPLGAGATGFITNIGDVDIWGVEFNVNFATGIEGLTFGIAGSVLDTEMAIDPEFAFVETAIQQMPALTGQPLQTHFVDGGELPGVAHETLTFNLDYLRPLGNRLDFATNLNFRYRSGQKDAAGLAINPAFGNESETDGYGLLNLSFTISDPQAWSATVFVRNLTDEVTEVGYLNGSLPGITRPRQIGLTVGLDL